MPQYAGSGCHPRNSIAGREPGLRTTGYESAGRTSEIELVALWVRHATPPEAFELTGVARLEPSTSELLDLGRGRVQVIDDEIEMHSVLPRPSPPAPVGTRR